MKFTVTWNEAKTEAQTEIGLFTYGQTVMFNGANQPTNNGCYGVIFRNKDKIFEQLNTSNEQLMKIIEETYDNVCQVIFKKGQDLLEEEKAAETKEEDVEKKAAPTSKAKPKTKTKNVAL